MKKSIDVKNYTRYRFPTNIRVDTAKKKEIIINSPKICPICGSTDVYKEKKLYRGRSKYLKILYCKKHYDAIKKSSEFYLAIYSTSIIIITIGLMILNYFLTSSILISSIMLMIGIIYLLYDGFRRILLRRIIAGYIYFYYYKDNSIISIKRSDWAKSFKALNDCSEDKFDLRTFKDLEKNISRNLIFAVIVIILFVIGLYSIPLLQSIVSFDIVYLGVLYIIISIVLIIYFIGKMSYYILKQEKMDGSEYS